MSKIPSERKTKKMILDSQPQMRKEADAKIHDAVRGAYRELGVTYDAGRTSDSDESRYGKDRTITFSENGTPVRRSRNWQLVVGICLVTVLFASAVVVVVYGKQRNKTTTSVADNGKEQTNINADVSVHVTVLAGNGADLPAGAQEVLSGTYHPGEKITLTAYSRQGDEFSHWEVSGNVDCIDDPQNFDAVLTVPDRDVTVTAIYVQITDAIDLDTVTFRDPPFTYHSALTAAVQYSHRRVADDDDLDYPDVADDVLCGFVLVPADAAKGHEGGIPVHFINREEDFLQFLQEEEEMFEDFGLKVVRPLTLTVIAGEDRDYMRVAVCVVATKKQIRNVFGGEKITKPYGNRYWMISGASRADFEAENEVDVVEPDPNKEQEYSFNIDDFADYWGDEKLKEKVYSIIDSYTLNGSFKSSYDLIPEEPVLYEQLAAVDGAVPYILRWILENEEGRGYKGALAVAIVAEILGKPITVEESELPEGFQCDYMYGTPKCFAAMRLVAEYYKKND
jgi:hypothetical protein